MDTIKGAIEEKKKAGKKTLLKVMAVAVSTGLLAVGAVAALDNIQGPGSGLSQVAEPDPVVLDIDEADMTDESESEEDTQEEKKRGFFSWLKIWFYGMLTGIAGFFATKIPWKKIFNKRNLIILLVLAAIFLLAKYVLPYYVDVPWGPDPTNAN
ncbi:MAG: hypothetical protein J6Q41_07150 [Firmicutes bacterium]|nr:hypothetical protein [Bacillota bacterium]